MFEFTSANPKSNLLERGPLPCMVDTVALDVSRGCMHGCTYCYTRTYRHRPRAETIVIFEDLGANLASRLARCRRPLRRIWLSPSCDPFQPHDRVQRITADVLEAVFAAGLELSFLTKGLPSPRCMEILEQNAARIQAQIGIASLDAVVLADLEPGAPNPTERLRIAREFVRKGIRTSVRIDPLMAGVSDSDAQLQDLFSAIAGAGVRKAVLSYLFLRPKIRASLSRSIRPEVRAVASRPDWLEAQLAGEGSNILLLPQEYRQERYTIAATIAERSGIDTVICSCKNPDLPGHYCGICGWP